jgi:hypothetical protein
LDGFKKAIIKARVQVNDSSLSYIPIDNLEDVFFLFAEETGKVIGMLGALSLPAEGPMLKEIGKVGGGNFCRLFAAATGFTH